MSASIGDIQDQIESTLCDDLDEEWDALLDQWEEASDAERTAVRNEVRGMRDFILDGIAITDSVESLRQALALQYLGVKCHWMTVNLQIQRTACEDDRPEECLLYEASAISLLVQRVESLLSHDQVERVATRLAGPIGG